MTRLEVGAEESIKTFQYFTDNYKKVIKARDKSFYRHNLSEEDNFDFVINKYSGDDYYCLNEYLRDGSVSEYPEKDLKSWAWCLHSSLQYLRSNVSNNTTVYRGINRKAPNSWSEGDRFYFGEFVSTSKSEDIASGFANGKTMLIIKIKNNGNNGHNNYCKDISYISQYDEEEILLTAFCRYDITDVRRDSYDGDVFYLNCIGY